MKYIITILLLLPLLSFGQQRDSFRKTDVIKTRFNIEARLHFPTVKTDLNFKPQGGFNIEPNGKLANALASYNFGVSQDIRLKDRAWLQLGLSYGTNNYIGFTYNTYEQMTYNLSLSYDITQGNHPWYGSAGIRYNHHTSWILTMYDLDTSKRINGQYAIINQYTLKRDYYQAKLGFGKLIPIDEDMDLRLEAFADYTIGSMIVNPSRGKLFSVGIKVGLTTFFHKWEKVE